MSYIFFEAPATAFVETGLPSGSQWVISYGSLGSSVTSWSNIYSMSTQITVYVFRFGSYEYATSSSAKGNGTLSLGCTFNGSGMSIFNGGTSTVNLHFLC
jgi:hypothetical protein